MTAVQADERICFDFLPHAPVVVQRHDGPLTSDAGLLPVAQFDARWRYTERMAACLGDDARVGPTHARLTMLRQRVYGIVAGYEDGNDHDALRDEPVFQLVAGRSPDERGPLASQPTLSRFENAVPIPALHRLLGFLLDTGIERLRERHGGALPAAVTLDLDATDDPTHGHQQLSLFHGYYGQHQYLPLVISEPTTRHVLVAHLRHGTAHAALGADGELRRVVAALRAARPDVQIHVRGDGGFGCPQMYAACEELGVTYTFGFATNPRLRRLTEDLVARAVRQFAETGRKQRLFAAFPYRADAWDRDRPVVAKAECHAGGTNLRFVVTDLPTASDAEAEARYDDYVERGESEQRMDELKNGLSAGRLSCHRFAANFVRLLLHAASYNLLNALRDHADVPRALRVAQPQTWRAHVIKVAATVVRSTRRVVVRLSGDWPGWADYHAIARRALAFRPCAPSS